MAAAEFPRHPLDVDLSLMVGISRSVRSWLSGVATGESFVGRVLLVAGGTASGQAVLLCSAPVLTRLYTPDDFGILAVYTAVLATLSIVAALRFELGIPVAGDDETAANVLVLGALALLGTVMCTAAGVMVWKAFSRGSAWEGLLSQALWLPLGIGAAGVYQILSHWAIRAQEFAVLGRTKLFQAVGAVVVQVGLGFTGAGAVGLVAGDVVGRFSGSGRLGLRLWRRDSRHLRRISLSSLKAGMRRFGRFALYSTGSALTNSIGLQVPPILFGLLYGSQVAGWYGLAYRIVGIPVFLVGGAVAQVYLGHAARYHHEDSVRLRILFKSCIRRLFLLGLLPAAITAAVGPAAFAMVFGEDWLEAGLYARALAVFFLAQLVVSPVSQTLTILGRQDLQFWWDVGRLLLVVGSIGIPAWIGMVPVGAVTVFSGATALAYLALLIMVAHQLTRVNAAGDGVERSWAFSGVTGGQEAG